MQPAVCNSMWQLPTLSLAIEGRLLYHAIMLQSLQHSKPHAPCSRSKDPMADRSNCSGRNRTRLPPAVVLAGIGILELRFSSGSACRLCHFCICSCRMRLHSCCRCSTGSESSKAWSISIVSATFLSIEREMVCSSTRRLTCRLRLRVLVELAGFLVAFGNAWG